MQDVFRGQSYRGVQNPLNPAGYPPALRQDGTYPPAPGANANGAYSSATGAYAPAAGSSSYLPPSSPYPAATGGGGTYSSAAYAPTTAFGGGTSALESAGFPGTYAAPQQSFAPVPAPAAAPPPTQEQVLRQQPSLEELLSTLGTRLQQQKQQQQQEGDKKEEEKKRSEAGMMEGTRPADAGVALLAEVDKFRRTHPGAYELLEQHARDFLDRGAPPADDQLGARIAAIAGGLRPMWTY